jgi:hypothetical protein
VKNWAVDNNLRPLRNALRTDIQPISIPVVHQFWELPAVHPDFETSYGYVRFTNHSAFLFDASQGLILGRFPGGFQRSSLPHTTPSNVSGGATVTPQVRPSSSSRAEGITCKIPPFKEDPASIPK